MPILNIVGGPKVRFGTRNLKEPIPRRADGMPALPHASQVKNSCLVNFRMGSFLFLFVGFTGEERAISVPRTWVPFASNIRRNGRNSYKTRERILRFSYSLEKFNLIHTPAKSVSAQHKLPQSLDGRGQTGYLFALGAASWIIFHSAADLARSLNAQTCFKC